MSVSTFVTSAIRSLISNTPTIAELEAAVSRIEAKIANLDARANEAAEDGDASAIEALEVSLSVERRLHAVARRSLAEAEARAAAATAAAAADAEARAAAELEARRAYLDARLEPSAVHAAFERINARILAARAALADACTEHDEARAEHERIHAERVALGGDVRPAVERDVLTMNLALQAAGDDADALFGVLDRDGRSLLRVACMGLTSSPTAPLRDIVEHVGTFWLSPRTHGTPSAYVCGALRSVATFARTCATLRELQAYAIAELGKAGDDEHRARLDEEARDLSTIAARAAHEALQRNGGDDLPDCTVKAGPSAEESKIFDQFLG